MQKKKRLRIDREKARQMLFDLAKEPETERTKLEESYSRILAEDIVAVENVPSFAKSPLDGYALRGEDTKDATKEHPVTLKITEEIAAGDIPHIAVTQGWAAKILTGAPIPEGCNAVVRYEETEFTEEEVTLTSPVPSGVNIVPAGDDISTGRVVATRGEKITPPIAGMLAALGYTDVLVYKKPLVTIISTGSELVEPGEKMMPGKIRNSSYHLIRGYLEEAGARVARSGIIYDDVDCIAKAIEQAVKESDMVITTGGVSVGDYDLVMAATEKTGAEKMFWKVRFRPGGTMLAAKKDGKLILGLSGNPASASIALHLLGIPFLRKIQGQPAMAPKRIRVELLDPIEKDSPYGRLVRGHLVLKDGKTYFKSMDWQGNGALSSLLGCDLIADLPEGTPPLLAGTVVDAYHILN